ncbi:hypothetical protein U9M48_023084 [Paspalum notatum var. saurae]|uniref:Glutathione transferase n=1 Tax=Paspalum notatum var. saurae TaxID=547442 RepID=A0AAQ3TPM4_PASNO
MAEAEATAGRLRLYSYWRSSSSHRVRIALNLKGVEYEYKAVNLLKGEQSDPEFVKLNPMKFVPALGHGNEVIGDSYAIALAIFGGQVPRASSSASRPFKEGFESPVGWILSSAQTHRIASIVASGIQPLHNITVLVSRLYLTSWHMSSAICLLHIDSVLGQLVFCKRFIDQKVGAGESVTWTQQQIERGFTAINVLTNPNGLAIENLIQLKGCAGKYATGDEVQLADIFLAPQIYAAIERTKIDMSNYPTLARLHSEYMAHPAFQAALPDKQPDAPSSS